MGEKYYRKTDWAGNVYYEKEEENDVDMSDIFPTFMFILEVIMAAGLMSFGFLGSFIVYNALHSALESLESGEWGWLIGAFLLSLIWLLVVGFIHIFLSEEYSRKGFWKYTNYIILLLESIFIHYCFGLDLVGSIIASIILLLCLIISDIIYASKQTPLYVWALLYLILLFIITLISQAL